MPERITSPLPPEVSSRVGGILQEALVELVDLALLGKQAHWNVVGGNFRAVHLQLDELVDVARQHADTVAERAAALGCPPNGQARDIAQSSSLTPLEPGWLEDRKVVDLVVERLQQTSARMRDRMKALEDPDPTSQDLLNDVLHDLEKQHWMFQAAAV